MINALHLIWMLPCAAGIGALLLLLIAMMAVAKDTDRMMNRKHR